MSAVLPSTLPMTVILRSVSGKSIAPTFAYCGTKGWLQMIAALRMVVELGDHWLDA